MAKTANKRLMDGGYTDVTVFHDPAYDSALVGVSADNRAIYDYELMVRGLMANDGMTMDDAVEQIDNCVNGFSQPDGPIIMYHIYD